MSQSYSGRGLRAQKKKHLQY